MSDNVKVQLPAVNSETATIATDEVGAQHYQRIKLDLGDDGASEPVVGSVPTHYADTMNLDAFSRLRVSQPVGLFDVQCQYDANPIRMESGATGTGSAGVHSANTRMVALACTAGAGTSFIQSYEYIPYQAGKSQLVFVTGVFGAGAAGATVDLGSFDAANGIFLRQNGTNGMQLVLRSSTSGSPVPRTVNQADWNIDPMDGTGPSGWTFDPEQNVIFGFDAQYLAMGRVRCALDIDGVIYPIHEYLSAQRIAVPYMQTLTLPIQMLVTTASAAKTAHFKCASVSSEGGFENPSAFGFSTPEKTAVAGNATPVHITGLRPLTEFNSIANRSRLQLTGVDLMVTGAQPVLWQLTVGATWAGGGDPTWQAINATYSASEYPNALGTVDSIGTIIASGYIASTASSRQAISREIISRYPITLDRAGAVRALGTLNLFVTGIGGTSASRAVLNFTELR
jgi:hypothetical protein